MIQMQMPIHTKAKPISIKAVPSCIAPSYPTYAFIFPFKNKKTVPAIKNKFAINVGVKINWFKSQGQISDSSY